MVTVFVALDMISSFELIACRGNPYLLKPLSTHPVSNEVEGSILPLCGHTLDPTVPPPAHIGRQRPRSTEHYSSGASSTSVKRWTKIKILSTFVILNTAPYPPTKIITPTIKISKKFGITSCQTVDSVYTDGVGAALKETLGTVQKQFDTGLLDTAWPELRRY